MNRYQSYPTLSRRVVLGAAALALTALAMSLLLVAPATLVPGNRELPPSAMAQAASAADASNGRLRVEVIAVREPSVAATQVHSLQPQAKRKQQS